MGKREASEDVAATDRRIDLTGADRAFLLAIEAWGAPGEPVDVRVLPSERAGKLERQVWSRLDPNRARSLREAWEQTHGKRGEPPLEPESARLRLCEAHRSEAHADIARVHPTWLIRALREESPAVQAAIVAHGPRPLSEASRGSTEAPKSLHLPPRPPHPEILSCVLALWTERLVGGEPVQQPDPPVIVALGGLSGRALYLLCRAAGMAKLSMAALSDVEEMTRRVEVDRRRWFGDRLEATSPEDQALVEHDVRSYASGGLSRPRRLALLGLVTVSRLLVQCEPFRVRWALQHLPYPIAKRIRSLMAQSAGHSPAGVRLESRILKLARERLTLEGRIS